RDGAKRTIHDKNFRVSRSLNLVPFQVESSVNMSKQRLVAVIALFAIVIAVCPPIADAHNVSKRDASFVESNKGMAIASFLYLGAKHMVTGYDHLLFLVGGIFFLYRLRDVVQYVSLFTVGHSLTLLAGVFGHLHANPYIVD